MKIQGPQKLDFFPLPIFRYDLNLRQNNSNRALKRGNRREMQTRGWGHHGPAGRSHSKESFRAEKKYWPLLRKVLLEYSFGVFYKSALI